VIDTEIFIESVIRETAASNDRYRSLFRHRHQVHPIPFSGRVNDAVVATVGVNPSDTEFSVAQRPLMDTAALWTAYLENYFSGDVHRWFSTWDRALAELGSGCSYRSGRVAHLDLSCRPTTPMGSLTGNDALLYDEMLRRDAKWFFKLIDSMPRLRLLLIAGCAGETYMGPFLEEVAPEHRSRLLGKHPQNGKARVGFYYLRTPSGNELPTFYCSVSPSSRAKRMLVTRMIENRDDLIPIVDSGDDARFRERHRIWQ
jgi:hypothetical protein